MSTSWLLMSVQIHVMPHVQGEKQQQRKACQEPPIGQPGHRNSWGWCCWLPFALEDCLTCATHEHTLSTLEQVETRRGMLALQIQHMQMVNSILRQSL